MQYNRSSDSCNALETIFMLTAHFARTFSHSAKAIFRKLALGLARQGAWPTSLYLRLIFTLMTTCIWNVAPANALESGLPYLAGVTIGTPVGKLPPPGLYYGNAVTEFDYRGKDNSDQNTGAKIRSTFEINLFSYVPPIQPIFGATYGAFIAQPVIARETTTPAGGMYQAFATANTIVSPAVLSWSLGKSLYFSIDYVFYPRDSLYDPSNPATIARNYVTNELGFGISYLGNGWDLTLHPLLDFNLTNPYNEYHSGSVFAMDYTAVRRFERLGLGVGGTIIDQFQNDTIGGQTVAAGAGNGLGNRYRNITVGPVLTYDFTYFTLKAFYNKSVYAQNGAAGNSFWLRLDYPVFSADAAKSTRQSTAR